MQYKNPKFNVGDTVVCVDAERAHTLVVGTEYVVTKAIPSAKDYRGGMITFDSGGYGVAYFGNRFELKSEPAQKEQQMNSMIVSDLTPKKQRKLAAVLDSLGYTFDHDLGSAHHTVVRFNAKSYSTNFGGYNTRLDGRVYISATGKKYKVILAEVLAALPVTPTKDFKDGCKVRVIENQGDYISAGAVGVLRNIQSGEVTFANDFWWLGESDLEVVPDDTPVTTDKGNPIEVPQVFEVGCTVERTDGEHEGMEVGATSVVTALKEDGRHVELEDYPRGHSKRMLKVTKGA